MSTQVQKATLSQRPPLYLWSGTPQCGGNCFLSSDGSREWEKLGNCQKMGSSAISVASRGQIWFVTEIMGLEQIDLIWAERWRRSDRRGLQIETATLTQGWQFGLDPALNGLSRNVFFFNFLYQIKSGSIDRLRCAVLVCLDSRLSWLLVNVTSIKLLTVWLQGPLSPPAKWDWCPWLHTVERSQLEV